MDCELTAVDDITYDSYLNPNNASARTIQRVLNENGQVARRMIKTHFISEANIQKRLEWAQEI